MALTRPDTALLQYTANSLYDLNGSPSEARLFIEAARALMALMPTRTQQGRGGTLHEYDPTMIKAALDKAERWYAANVVAGSLSDAGAVTFGGFANYR